MRVSLLPIFPVILHESFLLQITVIIVSYNVRYFLEQCLYSVRKAISNIAAEIIIVDNHSSDDTKTNLPDKFPEVKWIFNNNNAGFAKANNQALQLAKGEYVLFLNPDTILPEHFFDEMTRFMDTHPIAGACGVRMIDGVGNYLKESKRGFPSAWIAFCKMVGFTNLFGRSKLFSGYYLGHLNENEIQVVDALSGACFFARTKLVRECGGFDDRFFMYAEDIDLSFSIRKKGWNNYYLPSPVIIHFKGESTNKDEGYISLFYKAMQQFLDKHNLQKSPVSGYILKAAVSFKTNLDKAFIKIQKQKPQKPIVRPLEFVLLGDEATCRDVRTLLESKKTTNTEIKTEKEIVLCEGKEYTFRMMVTLISSMPGQRYWFHAHGSDAIISSHNKKIKGIAIPFKRSK